MYCVRLALENNTGMHPATRESNRDFRVNESPTKLKIELIGGGWRIRGRERREGEG